MKPVSCSICEQKFGRPSKLLAHVKRIHRNDPRFHFRCSLCHTLCKNYRIFWRHFQKNHKDADVNQANDIDSADVDENQYIENGKFFLIKYYM